MKAMAFWKMHGAGNDFILVDDREGTFPVGDRPLRERMANRRTGIGSDGIILIQKSRKADIRMRFFNPDGGEAEMCGNGARCLARLAHEIGAAPAAMSIETMAGPVRAEVQGPNVRLVMSAPHDWRMNRSLTLEETKVSYHFVNTGVPHAVVEAADLAAHDVAGMGQGIRRHADFAPAGTNADFVAVAGPRALRIRTYERGVEAETLACGTGIVAAALIAGRLGRVTPPVEVTTVGGYVLTVDFRLTEDGAEGVTLLGPAAHVFRGTYEAE